MAKITRKEGKIVALKQAVKSLDTSEGRVGWFESAVYEDGQPVAGVAYVQEYGSPKRSIPPRPFFRPAAEENQTAWANVAAQISKRVLAGKLPPESMNEALCLEAEGDVRKNIKRLMAPPLSLLTLLARKDRKESDKRRKKAMKYGPQPEYKFGGKRLGQLAAQLNDGPPDVTGVSTKPLVDSGYLLATLTSQVTKK